MDGTLARNTRSVIGHNGLFAIGPHTQHGRSLPNQAVTEGHETVAKLIPNGVIALSWYPGQRRELVADSSLIPGAVEEMLRWDPPSHYQGRWTLRDAELHGTVIPAGQRVILITGLAVHDERKYPDPEFFDIHRDIGRHVSFGFGRHLCLGASLARLETRDRVRGTACQVPRLHLRPLWRGAAPLR
jgi:Cytochrome P450